jgi:hypothetical protein
MKMFFISFKGQRYFFPSRAKTLEEVAEEAEVPVAMVSEADMRRTNGITYVWTPPSVLLRVMGVSEEMAEELVLSEKL